MPFKSSGRGAYGPQGQKVIKGPLAPVWVTSGALPNATTAAYSYQLVATDDSGDAPTYALASGSIPTGLSLSSSGLISGTATGASTTYTFTVNATDVNGRTTTSGSLTITTVLVINGLPSQGTPSGMSTTTDNGKFVLYRTTSGDSTVTVTPGGKIVAAIIGAGSIAGQSCSTCSKMGGHRGGMSIIRFTVPAGVTSLLISVGGTSTNSCGGQGSGGFNGGGAGGAWVNYGQGYGSQYQNSTGGGGYSGIFNTAGKTQGNTYLMVGGGGGAGQGGTVNAAYGGGLEQSGGTDTGGNGPGGGGTTTGGGSHTNQGSAWTGGGGGSGSAGSALQGGRGEDSELDQGGGGGGGYFGGGGGTGGGGCNGGPGGGGSGKINTVAYDSYFNYSDIASLKSGLSSNYGVTGSVIPSTAGNPSNAGTIYLAAGA